MSIVAWPSITQYGVPGGAVNGPSKDERGVALIRWGYSQLQEEASYERARADAAMARLKLARVVMQYAYNKICNARMEEFPGPPMWDAMDELKKALADIGPLPGELAT